MNAIQYHRYDLNTALAPEGVYSVAGGHILPALFRGTRVSLTSRKTMGVFAWKTSTEDLAHVAKLCEQGLLRPVIDQTYSLRDTAKALGAIGERSTKGIGVVQFDGSKTKKAF